MRLALDVVVLDDQQPFGARRDEVLDAVERCFQCLGGRRLDQVGKRAVRQAVLPLFLQRDDLHRDVPRRGIELEVVEHGPAEHVRQEDVQRDRRRAGIGGPATGRGAAGGDDALEALVARQPQQDARVMRVVLDDQQDRVARLRCRSRSSGMCSSRATGSTGSVGGCRRAAVRPPDELAGGRAGVVSGR